MKQCSDKKELLWLDVYGELTQKERLNWEKHLETCRACSLERENLLELLKNVKEAMPAVSLSHEDAGALKNAITGKIRENRDNAWLGKPFLGGYIKPIHALVACCLLIVAFGWFSLKGLQPTTAVQTISDRQVEEQMIAKDLDLLENLELLEEMDTLEKLGKVMSRRNATI
ncbi:MAG: zf-HC2 domain-containing protein [Candidatus Omnitrophica bacterium]|nr:zf-HC2 domain-containing protein [Candidatus Omnitrophota bacterium]